MFDKICETFTSKVDSYCLKDNLHVWVSMSVAMPRFLNGPTKAFLFSYCYASSSWEAFSKKRIPGIDKTAANFLNSRQISGHYLLANSFLSFGNIYKYSAQILNTPFLQNSSGQLLRLLANVFSSNTSAKMFALPG